MSEERSDKCEVCGKNLIYATNQKDSKDLTCEFCKKVFNTNIYCEQSHYICDSCHSTEPIEVIEKICEKSKIKDPFELADLIMKHPNFKVYGPEHHVLTPTVILTSLRNNSILKPNGDEISFFDIKEAIRRASKIPGGWCGFYGSCGAGMGTGVAISIFTGATPSTDKPRSQANEMTSRSLAKIADNLEHCCKRSVKISISEALIFLREKFEIKLEYILENCVFSDINNKCERERCPIF
ncbi:MAG: DUF5714 domain-containing protein [Promethearchaeota archaeon]|jgi:hypothetical protein